MVKYACEVGWEYLKPEEAERLRGGRTGLILKEVFRDQLSKLNSEFINEVIIEDLVKKLEKLPATREG